MILRIAEPRPDGETIGVLAVALADRRSTLSASRERGPVVGSTACSGRGSTSRTRLRTDAGDRRVHAQTGDDLLRCAQEPQTLRPQMVLKNLYLTTRYLVRP